SAGVRVDEDVARNCRPAAQVLQVDVGVGAVLEINVSGAVGSGAAVGEAVDGECAVIDLQVAGERIGGSGQGLGPGLEFHDRERSAAALLNDAAEGGAAAGLAGAYQQDRRGCRGVINRSAARQKA